MALEKKNEEVKQRRTKYQSDYKKRREAESNTNNNEIGLSASLPDRKRRKIMKINMIDNNKHTKDNKQLRENRKRKSDSPSARQVIKNEMKMEKRKAKGDEIENRKRKKKRVNNRDLDARRWQFKFFKNDKRKEKKRNDNNKNETKSKMKSEKKRLGNNNDINDDARHKRQITSAIKESIESIDKLNGNVIVNVYCNNYYNYIRRNTNNGNKITVTKSREMNINQNISEIDNIEELKNMKSNDNKRNKMNQCDRRQGSLSESKELKENESQESNESKRRKHTRQRSRTHSPFVRNEITDKIASAISKAVDGGSAGIEVNNYNFWGKSKMRVACGNQIGNQNQHITDSINHTNTGTMTEIHGNVDTNSDSDSDSHSDSDREEQDSDM